MIEPYQNGVHPLPPCSVCDEPNQTERELVEVTATFLKYDDVGGTLTLKKGAR